MSGISTSLDPLSEGTAKSNEKARYDCNMWVYNTKSKYRYCHPLSFSSSHSSVQVIIAERHNHWKRANKHFRIITLILNKYSPISQGQSKDAGIFTWKFWP